MHLCILKLCSLSFTGLDSGSLHTGHLNIKYSYKGFTTNYIRPREFWLSKMTSVLSSIFKFASFSITIHSCLNSKLIKVFFFKDIILNAKFSMLHYRFVLRFADWAGDDFIMNYSFFAKGVAAFCTFYNYFFYSSACLFWLLIDSANIFIIHKITLQESYPMSLIHR